MLPTPFRSIADLIRNPRLGWVGMDITCNALHLAQVEKVGQQYILDAQWTAFPEPMKARLTDTESPDELGHEQAIDSMLRQAKNAKHLFSPSATAFTIGDGSIDYRELDIDVNAPSEFDHAVQMELEKESSYDFVSHQVKAWELPTNRKSNTNKQCAAVVSAEYDFTVWLGERVSDAGYTPEVLDAIPCALARAAQLFLSDSDQCCLMVHLGDGCTTLTQAYQGQPIVTRVLNHHGFENVLLPLGQRFDIHSSEAYLLMLRASKASKETSHHSAELIEILSEYQLRFVHSVADEIYRTLEYIRTDQNGTEPTGILVCGNGSIMPDVCSQFEQLLELPSEVWEIPLHKNACAALPTSLYAVAAGLSAIAWEKP